MGCGGLGEGGGGGGGHGDGGGVSGGRGEGGGGGSGDGALGTEGGMAGGKLEGKPSVEERTAWTLSTMPAVPSIAAATAQHHEKTELHGAAPRRGEVLRGVLVFCGPMLELLGVSSSGPQSHAPPSSGSLAR